MNIGPQKLRKTCVNIQGQNDEAVEILTYLGSFLDNDSSEEKDIQLRGERIFFIRKTTASICK